MPELARRPPLFHLLSPLMCRDLGWMARVKRRRLPRSMRETSKVANAQSANYNGEHRTTHHLGHWLAAHAEEDMGSPRGLNARKALLPVVTIAIAILACGGARTTPTAAAVEDQSTANDSQALTTAPDSDSEPVPIHSQATVDDITFSISEVVFPADEEVRQGSDLNSTPSPSTHYMFLSITASCDSTSSGSCPLGSLRLVDSNGEEIFPVLGTAGISCESPIGTFQTGATWDICLVFIAPADDPGLLLRHESFFGEETYFALQ